jgi:hypothetical protein
MKRFHALYFHCTLHLQHLRKSAQTTRRVSLQLESAHRLNNSPLRLNNRSSFRIYYKPQWVRQPPNITTFCSARTESVQFLEKIFEGTDLKYRHR